MGLEPGVFFKDKLDALVPAAAADAPPRRGKAVSVLASVDDAERDRAASVGLVYGWVDTILQVCAESDNQLHDEQLAATARLERENASLRASLAALELQFARHETRVAEIAGENAALKLTIDHLRAKRGPKGERGEPGARIVAWAIDEQAFTATPQLSDGSIAAPLALRPVLASLARELAEAERRP